MAEIATGERDVEPDAPSHVKGIAQGNSKGSYEKSVGHLPDGRSTSQRSTGINAGARDPIDPRMPNISPP